MANIAYIPCESQQWDALIDSRNQKLLPENTTITPRPSWCRMVWRRWWKLVPECDILQKIPRILAGHRGICCNIGANASSQNDEYCDFLLDRRPLYYVKSRCLAKTGEGVYRTYSGDAGSGWGWGGCNNQIFSNTSMLRGLINTNTKFGYILLNRTGAHWSTDWQANIQSGIVSWGNVRQTAEEHSNFDISPVVCWVDKHLIFLIMD